MANVVVTLVLGILTGADTYLRLMDRVHYRLTGAVVFRHSMRMRALLRLERWKAEEAARRG